MRRAGKNTQQSNEPALDKGAVLASVVREGLPKRRGGERYKIGRECQKQVDRS